MHRTEGKVDQPEVLCSIPAMTVQMLRLRNVGRSQKFESGKDEVAVVALRGSVSVDTGSQKIDLAEKDVAYLTRGASFVLESKEDADVLWARAPAGRAFPSYTRRFSEVKPVVSGAQSYTRHIYTSIGEKEHADRLIVGFVEGDTGNWTSFPPHRHDGKPEVYVYYGMGKRFGVQLVLGDEDRAYVVREGDAVLFEKGYHPNVATPGVGMNFVWIISAEPAERNLAVELHPEYKDMPTGPTHLTTK
ncbi:MAG TPA: 5-deoxy-glucuronate isomerase [Nitrososphaerales archaeon]|nr:5-deoxy-glucuronate isomerase [Nitrososphaerales archaeon]